MAAARGTRSGAGETPADSIPPSSPRASSSALILFAHGSRDPEWSAPFVDIRRRVAERLPGLHVKLAFLEFTPPSLADSVAELAAAGCPRITIAPLFMAQGGHLKHDLPRLIGDLGHRHPSVVLELLPAAGDAARVRAAIGDWLVDAVAGGARK